MQPPQVRLYERAEIMETSQETYDRAGLTIQEIINVTEIAVPKIERRCLIAAHNTNLDLGGTMLVWTEIKSDGSVDPDRLFPLVGSKTATKAVFNCIAEEIKYLKFPKPRAQGRVAFTLPVEFYNK